MQQSLDGINQDVSRSRVALEGLTAGVKGLAVGIAASFSVGTITQFGAAVVRAGDAAQQLQAKLTQAVGSGAFEQAKQSAQELGVSVASVGQTMARLGNALKEAGASRQQLVLITETLVQMGRIAGATGAEVESALTQFAQGLSTGRLQGDELRSVLEAMPPLARLLADELGVGVGELRDLGAEGKITSDVILRAFENGADGIRKQFETLPTSLDQATARMQNSFAELFAAIDRQFSGSAFAKALFGGIDAAAQRLTDIIEPGPVLTSRADEMAAVQRQIDALNQGRANAVAVGLSTEDYDKQIRDLNVLLRAQEQALEYATQASIATREAAKAAEDMAEAVGGDAGNRPFQNPVPFPAARPGLEARGYYEAEQKAQQGRVEAAKRANDDLRRLEQERTDEAIDAIQAEVAAFEDAQEKKRKATEDFNAFLLDIEQDVADEKRRTAEAEAQRRADILAQPYKELASDITDIVADGINQALADPGNYNFGNIAESFADAMSSAVSGSLSIAITQPLTQAIADIGSGQYSSFVDFAQKNPTLTGTAGGFVAGTLTSQLVGQDGKFAGVGAGAGGFAGAKIGTALQPFLLSNPATAGLAPFAPLIGGLLGGVGGGLLGGLFGSENNLGNDRSAQTFNTARGIVYSDASFSPENRSITSGIAGELQTLVDLFGDLGGSVERFNIRLEAGNKSGITVDGKKYDTAAEALAASIEKLIGSTSGLTATQQTILANTQGGTAAEIGADLQFGETYDALTFTGGELNRALKELEQTFGAAGRRADELGLSVDALAQAHLEAAEAVIAEYDARLRSTSLTIQQLGGANPLDVALAQLALRMEELARSAEELGLPLDQVVNAHNRQAEALVRQYAAQQENLRLQLRQISGEQSVGLQLALLNAQMQQLAESALALEVPLDLVIEAHNRAAEAIIEQHQNLIRQTEQQVRDQERALAQQGRSVQDFFAGLIDPLEAVIANDNRLSPLARISQSRSEFRDLAGRAQDGDVEAIRALSGAGSNLLNLSQQFLGSGGLGGEISSEVVNVIRATVGDLRQEQGETLADLPAVQRETIAEVVATLIDSREQMVDELQRLRRELENLRRAA